MGIVMVLFVVCVGRGREDGKWVFYCIFMFC